MVERDGGGSGRRQFTPSRAPPKSKSTITAKICFSGCMFFAVLCACLLAALILVGKHLHENTKNPRSSLGTTPNPTESQIYKSPKPGSNQLPAKDPLIWRLPTDTYPLKYNIHFYPDVSNGDYNGFINITFNVTKPRSAIILNVYNLTIDRTDVFRLGEYTARKIDVENVTIENVREVVVVNLKEQVEAGVYLLNFQFSGSMLNKTRGFYRSTYKDRKSNRTSNMATSKFEPTYARQAYPCFDEPDKKANYTVHLVIPNNDEYIALSNMPQTGEEVLPDGKTKRVDFMESVRMSTYLSCFIVSDFKYTEDKINTTFGMIDLRVYSTPAQVEKTRFALQVGKDITEYFVNKYFDISYPLPKLDMVAIPDFVSGAMEHWGLITYRETALLFDEATSSTINQQRVALVIAHEIAHSWFGNLVTMKWWDDLWLNEGFATYISFKGLDQIMGDWEMLNQFPIDQMHSVLSLDATLGSHPIIVKDILTPDEITEVFDSITYNKGASVLRMLEDAVGEENFRKGVTNYLNTHKYENAVTQNLLDKLQEQVGEETDVTEFMRTFTVQMGYPIINVVQDSPGVFTLKQTRYLTNPDSVKGKEIKESPYNYKWTIPITFRTDKNDTVQRTWFLHTDEEIKITVDFDAWFKINCDQVGYYRVNYPELVWHQLSTNINVMNNADKAHLLEESFSIAEAQQLSYTIPLEMTKFLKDDRNYVPWAVAADKFHQIKRFLSNSISFVSLKNYVTNLVDGAYNQYNWTTTTEDTHLQKRARIIILDLACSFGHEGCLTEAKRLFEEWINSNTTEQLPQDTRALIYNYGMQGANEREWDVLFSRFNAEIDASEKLKLMHGLASVKETWLLTRFINYAKDDTYVRSQDYFTLLQYISANPSGTALVWDYVRENWLNIVARFGLNDRYLGRMVAFITRSFSSELKLNEMKQFFADNPEAGAGAAARTQALETVQNNIDWLAKNRNDVELWLEAETTRNQA